METGEETDVNINDSFTNTFDNVYIDKMFSKIETASENLISGEGE
jgi:hypothetical protein